MKGAEPEYNQSLHLNRIRDPEPYKQIHDCFTSIFSQHLYDNVKTNTLLRLRQGYGGSATFSKVTFDNYLSILFTLFITESKTIKQCWSEADSLMKTLQTVDDMDYKRWVDINNHICYGSVQTLQNLGDNEMQSISFTELLQQQLNKVINNPIWANKIPKNRIRNYEDEYTIYKDIQFKFKVENESTRTFIQLLRSVLINSFQLFKLKFPADKIPLQVFTQKLIVQIQILKINYLKKCSRPMDVLKRKTPVKPAHEYFASGHKRVKNVKNTRCQSCKQCHSTKGCTCKFKVLCDECYIAHIQEMKANECYSAIRKNKQSDNNMDKLWSLL
ncbi:Hypothetical_protein [Hexamita inflata]|uniref:Hypothetical_protein n=1 Tax=Hexamita inflata TaxID=28002 RepID=A0AA86UDB1_9EUKA|nr:Hypothetical protein HINF_LOCUS41310 [Hexamita inflata]